MNLRNGPDKSNSNRTAKAISAISIAGILIAVAFLSGLLSVIGSETAIAQQNLTATNATATNATGTTIGNQTAAGNQTGTAATTGGNNTAGTTTVY
jgi:hypothetical protein